MKYKLALFSFSIFLLLISLSLVYAFESEVYQIGIDIPATEEVDGEVIRKTSGTDDGPSGSPSSKDKDTPQLIPTKTDTQDGDEITLEAPPRESFFSRMTGAVIGGVTDFSKTTGGKVALIFVSMIGILTVLIVVKNRGLKKASKSKTTQEPISQTDDSKEVED